MVIAILNIKGGSGRTTVSTNLAVCFAHMGQSVCVVDTDPQQSSMAWAENRESNLPLVTVVGAINAKVAGQTIKSMSSRYDIVIVDGMPSVAEMTTTVILAADFILIPVQLSPIDFKAMPFPILHA